MKPLFVFIASCLFTAAIHAKLPALSDEAKAKAAETAAKTAHTGKVDAYLLCKSQDKVAARYNKASKTVATACADPGPFVYTPAPAPVAAASATAPVATLADTAKKTP